MGKKIYDGCCSPHESYSHSLPERQNRFHAECEALSTMVYLLTEFFFGRSTDQIYLLLMQGLCAYPGLSIEAVDHELFFSSVKVVPMPLNIMIDKY